MHQATGRSFLRALMDYVLHTWGNSICSLNVTDDGREKRGTFPQEVGKTRGVPSPTMDTGSGSPEHTRPGWV